MIAWGNRMLANPLIQRIGWVTSGFMLSQVLRLVTNVILARLLAPQLFGIMLIVNTLRTGVELITDVGIGQNIVTSKDGDKKGFLNTAWTIQIIRGLLLFALAAATVSPIARFYGDPELAPVLLLASTILIITGFCPPTRFLFQKHQRTKTHSMFDLALALVNAVLHIGLAIIWPTIWALVWAAISHGLVVALASAYYYDWRSLRLQLDRKYVRSIFNFGKWIFLSSLVYFAALNFDRLYFAKEMPLAVLGVYAIARTLADAGTIGIQRLASIIIFPAIAAAQSRGDALRQRIGKPRAMSLALVSVSLGGAIAISDLIIELIYDDRYLGAAAVLPLLLFGVWFSTLSTIAEAIQLGLSRPANTAMANLLKLIWVITLLPTALIYGGIVPALLVVAFADLPRYLVLLVAEIRSGLSFIFQDLGLTVAMIGITALFRFVLVQLGLVDGMLSWLEYAKLLA